ncbi:MAG: LysR family transcriptional regulator [Proteobacteria bacterium]|nr:LysR family transcriptional regulator [Pseudomonadota bacterium]
MLPDLNRLKVFYHVFLQQSITAAAQTLCITPSAVSQQLKRLEQELRLPVFVRQHKRLVPTPAGRRLFTLAQPLIEELQAGIELMQEERTEPAGLIRFGAPVEFGSTYLPHVIAAFRTTHDKVVFNIELQPPASLIAMVDSGDLDFAFVDTFPTKEQAVGNLSAFNIRPIIEEEVVLACSRQYQQKQLVDDQSFSGLLGLHFISQQRDAHALNNWFLHHFKKIAPSLEIVLSVSSHQAVVNAIKHHLGLGIIVSHLAWNDIRSGQVVVLRRNSSQAKNRISVIQLQGKIPTLRERLFLKHFEQMARSSKTLQRFNLIIDSR